MANPHFGKVAELLKHGLLAEVLATDRPRRFAETHAGSASYPLTHSPERNYGIYRFLRTTNQTLRSSAYRHVLASLSGEGGATTLERCPGSPLVAMSILGKDAEYRFFDIDPQSVESIETAADQLQLAALVQARAEDGSLGVTREFGDEPAGCVHIDPFDPFSPGATGGPTPVELARAIGGAGTTVLFWYGYEQPNERYWAWNEIAGAQPSRWYIGDLEYAELESDSGILGCGVLIGNASDDAVARCTAYGQALAQSYEEAELPSGGRGSLSFGWQ